MCLDMHIILYRHDTIKYVNTHISRLDSYVNKCVISTRKKEPHETMLLSRRDS